jgi:Raf kinase inhibitor-like YbhB/YbcL family protein
MELTSNSFSAGQPIPSPFALCRPDPDSQVTFAENRNPQLAWSDVPANTKSFALICADPDVPSRPDDVNVGDREVPADLARVDFFHWVLVDLPAAARMIEEGEFSAGVVPHGKDAGIGPQGTRAGINDYTNWFAGDPDMEGDYYGYDGPCPPWNDSIIHRYVFTLYALDVEHVPAQGRFDGRDLRLLIADHVIANAELTGTYALNPRLLG